jgi:FMN phosphatase YigB (HAD superfamily)
MKPRTVFVDVDDTLIRSAGSRRIPIPAVIERVRRLKDEGVVLYLWSSGGAKYCEETAAHLGMTDCFVGFLSKPDMYIDDQPANEWRYCVHVYPWQLDEAQCVTGVAGDEFGALRAD